MNCFLWEVNAGKASGVRDESELTKHREDALVGSHSWGSVRVRVVDEQKCLPVPELPSQPSE